MSVSWPDSGDGAAPSNEAGRDALIGSLLGQISEQRSQIEALRVEVAELRRQLGLNSRNSGKPPSSDGLKKPARTTSLREASGKKPGGQKGHPGGTLRRSEAPDAIVEHYPEVCAKCGAPLSAAAASEPIARQVFDLPQPQPLIVTEHRAHHCRCAACGSQTRAAFPEGVN